MNFNDWAEQLYDQNYADPTNSIGDPYTDYGLECTAKPDQDKKIPMGEVPKGILTEVKSPMGG